MDFVTRFGIVLFMFFPTINKTFHLSSNQLAVIYRKCQSKDIKTLLFSATFSPEVGEWCDTSLDNLIKVYIGGRQAISQLKKTIALHKSYSTTLSKNIFNVFRNTAAKTIEQKLIYTGQESGKIMALRNIFNEVHF